MTVGELRHILSTFSDDLRVLVDGYEDGYSDLAVDRIEILNVYLDLEAPRYRGAWQEADSSRPRQPRVAGLVIPSMGGSWNIETLKERLDPDFVQAVSSS